MWARVLHFLRITYLVELFFCAVIIGLFLLFADYKNYWGL